MRDKQVNRERRAGSLNSAITEGMPGPHVDAGGLVTVAFLKAQLDEGSDHLGIFMPLVIDAIANIHEKSFVTIDVQKELAARHKLAMPQPTIETLLKRAVAKRAIQRNLGRYEKSNTFPNTSRITSEKAKIEESQLRLGEALISHAKRRGLTIESPDAALDLIFKFLDEEQVIVLIRDFNVSGHSPKEGGHEHRVIAEFIQDVVDRDPGLQAAFAGIIEGLVLYQAAFLPDAAIGSPRFKDLVAFFDSTLVRQALGYEGEEMKILLHEMVQILKAEGVLCRILDKTVSEIDRILQRYEVLMATSAGRSTLRQSPMSRHFLNERFSPGDIRQMSALLERDVIKAGFQIHTTPRRVPAYTSDEKALARRIADPKTKDEAEPRVVHDVDCIAAVLTIRRGQIFRFIEEAKAVFVTSSSLLVRNVRIWFEEDEDSSGMLPIIHIRALSNLAWLKRPKLAAEFKRREIIALCAAALRPRASTWQRFLNHLVRLEHEKELSSDEVSIILASAMSDRLLREAEVERDGDVDAVTLDDVVNRVKGHYVAHYESKLSEMVERTRAETARADAAEQSAADRERRRTVALQRRAQKLSSRLTTTAYHAAVIIIAVGAVAAAYSHPFHAGIFGILLAMAVVVFLGLEVLGVLRHASELRAIADVRITAWFRSWLETGARPNDSDASE